MCFQVCTFFIPMMHLYYYGDWWLAFCETIKGTLNDVTALLLMRPTYHSDSNGESGHVTGGVGGTDRIPQGAL